MGHTGCLRPGGATPGVGGCPGGHPRHPHRGLREQAPGSRLRSFGEGPRQPRQPCCEPCRCARHGIEVGSRALHADPGTPRAHHRSRAKGAGCDESDEHEHRGVSPLVGRSGRDGFRPSRILGPVPGAGRRCSPRRRVRTKLRAVPQHARQRPVATGAHHNQRSAWRAEERGRDRLRSRNLTARQTAAASDHRGAEDR